MVEARYILLSRGTAVPCPQHSINLPSPNIPKSIPVQNIPQDDSPNVPVQRNWYLVTLTQVSKRELFCKQILHAIEQEKLQDVILRVEMPKESVYQNLVLLETTSFKALRDRLRQLDYDPKISPKPLTSDQVNRMLGF
jgi:hypothetical protein